MKNHLWRQDHWFCDRKNKFAYKMNRYSATANSTLEVTCKKCLHSAHLYAKSKSIEHPGHEYYTNWLERIQTAEEAANRG